MCLERVNQVILHVIVLSGHWFESSLRAVQRIGFFLQSSNISNTSRRCKKSMQRGKIFNLFLDNQRAVAGSVENTVNAERTTLDHKFRKRQDRRGWRHCSCCVHHPCRRWIDAEQKEKVGIIPRFMQNKSTRKAQFSLCFSC